MDRETVPCTALGGACRRRNPEHVLADLHRGQHPSVRTGQDPGGARPDSGRGLRRDGPGPDRYPGYRGARILCPRPVRHGRGRGETRSLQAPGGVVPRRRHDHHRPGTAQGCRGTPGRTALVQGHAGGVRKFPGRRISGRRFPDMRRPVRQRGGSLRHHSGGRRHPVRRPGHHGHVWERARFRCHRLSAVGGSHGSLAAGRHVPGGLQHPGLCGAGPVAVLRDSLRHPAGQGAGSVRRSGPGAAVGPGLCSCRRNPCAGHAGRPRLVGPDA